MNALSRLEAIRAALSAKGMPSLVKTWCGGPATTRRQRVPFIDHRYSLKRELYRSLQISAEQADLVGVAVRSQAAPGRVAQLRVRCPVAELDLAHERRPGPAGRPGVLPGDLAGERGGGLLQRCQRGEQVVEGGFGEAGADV